MTIQPPTIHSPSPSLQNLQRWLSYQQRCHLPHVIATQHTSYRSGTRSKFFRSTFTNTTILLGHKNLTLAISHVSSHTSGTALTLTQITVHRWHPGQSTTITQNSHDKDTPSGSIRALSTWATLLRQGKTRAQNNNPTLYLRDQQSQPSQRTSPSSRPNPTCNF